MNWMEELKEATPKETHQIANLKKVIAAEAADNPPHEVSIYCFRDERGGVRIAEISCTWRYETGSVAGASYMRSEPECQSIILAAEDYLMRCTDQVEDHGHGHIYDPEQEARQALIYQLRGKNTWTDMPKWEERKVNPFATWS